MQGKLKLYIREILDDSVRSKVEFVSSNIGQTSLSEFAGN